MLNIIFNSKYKKTQENFRFRCFHYIYQKKSQGWSELIFDTFECNLQMKVSNLDNWDLIWLQSNLTSHLDINYTKSDVKHKWEVADPLRPSHLDRDRDKDIRCEKCTARGNGLSMLWLTYVFVSV